MKTRRIVPLVLVLTTLIIGCGDDPYAPTIDEVIGSYVLTDLVVTQGTATNDLIAEGVTADITLLTDGTTTGTLFIPASVNIDGVDLNDDLAGTWSLRGDKIDFDHSADTFLRDVEWTYSEGQISVDAGWIFAVLDRQ